MLGDSKREVGKIEVLFLGNLEFSWEEKRIEYKDFEVRKWLIFSERMEFFRRRVIGI